MNVDIGAEAAQFPEKENLNGIFVAVQDNSGIRNMSIVHSKSHLYCVRPAGLWPSVPKLETGLLNCRMCQPKE